MISSVHRKPSVKMNQNKIKQNQELSFFLWSTKNSTAHLILFPIESSFWNSLQLKKYLPEIIEQQQRKISDP